MPAPIELISGRTYAVVEADSRVVTLSTCSASAIPSCHGLSEKGRDIGYDHQLTSRFQLVTTGKFSLFPVVTSIPCNGHFTRKQSAQNRWFCRSNDGLKTSILFVVLPDIVLSTYAVLVELRRL